MALAARIADIWIRPGYWLRSPQVADLARQWFGLGAEDYVQILEAVGAQFPEVAEMFQIQIQDAIEVEGILDQAREALAIRNVQSSSAPLGGELRFDDRNSSGSPPIALSPTVSIDAAAGQDQPPSFDALTGLFDRQHLEDVLARELATARSQRWPLSVALLELDDGQRTDGRLGGDGDHLLIDLGRLLGGHIRCHDVVARYDDAEFALLLPACGVEAARGLLERLLALIHDRELTLANGSRVRITVSAGLATYPDTGLAQCASLQQLLDAAEQALQAARGRGGSRLAIYGE